MGKPDLPRTSLGMRELEGTACRWLEQRHFSRRAEMWQGAERFKGEQTKGPKGLARGPMVLTTRPPSCHGYCPHQAGAPLWVKEERSPIFQL